jgi:hypothetical protein
VVLSRQQLARVRDGTCTAVLVAHDGPSYARGATIALQPAAARPAVLRVVAVEVREIALREIDDDQARALGHDDVDALMGFWVEEHGLWNEQATATLVRFEVDRSAPGRFLHRDSSRGYTADRFMAMLGEPEAVDDDTLALARRAAQRAEQARVERLLEQRRSLPEGQRLNLVLRDAAARGVELGGSLHAVRKRIEALEHKTYRAVDRATEQ